ncbi:K(+)-transporting ATPase subunit F [Acetonema longum]|uniref:K(+)-transporting ATPase subunit F n=1 Tax=Acetonema longum TaxID=2374 RepID=UPI0009FFA39B
MPCLLEDRRCGIFCDQAARSVLTVFLRIAPRSCHYLYLEWSYNKGCKWPLAIMEAGRQENMVEYWLTGLAGVLLLVYLLYALLNPEEF